MRQSITISDGPVNSAAGLRAGAVAVARVAVGVVASRLGVGGLRADDRDGRRSRCAPIRSAPADLLGPYDGIVLDADSDRPSRAPLVAASWAFERGIGFQAPLGAREVVVETGADGRYTIPRLDDLPERRCRPASAASR